MREAIRLVHVHRAAEHDQAVVAADIGLQLGLAGEIDVANAKAVTAQQRVEQPQRFAGGVLEDEQLAHRADSISSRIRDVCAGAIHFLRRCVYRLPHQRRCADDNFQSRRDPRRPARRILRGPRRLHLSHRQGRDGRQTVDATLEGRRQRVVRAGCAQRRDGNGGARRVTALVHLHQRRRVAVPDCESGEVSAAAVDCCSASSTASRCCW